MKKSTLVIIGTTLIAVLVTASCVMPAGTSPTDGNEQASGIPGLDGTPDTGLTDMMQNGNPSDGFKSGTTGDCLWEMRNLKLVISGAGAMADYGSVNDTPWGPGITSVEIGDEVTRIGKFAFSNCTSLAYIDVGDSVSSIGTCAFERLSFYNCEGTSISANSGNLAGHVFTGSGDRRFFQGPDIAGTTGDCTWGLYGTRLVIEGRGAMADYTSGSGTPWASLDFSSVEIREGVTYIGSFAFHGLATITNAGIADSVTAVGDSAFRGCTSLESITFPCSLTTIGGHAFSGCTAITSVIFPDSVTAVGERAFSDCTSLTSVETGVSLTIIGNGAFEYCTAITSVVFGDSVASIGASAFSYCINIASLSIPGSVGFIGEGAFDGLTFYDADRVTVLEPAAEHLAGNVFEGTGSDGRLYLSVIEPDASGTTGDCVWEIFGTELYIRGSGITGSYGDAADTPWYAYRDCITSVTICDGVYEIGSNVFYGYASLESVVFADSVTEVADHAFHGCTGLTYVQFGANLDRLGTDAFGGITFTDGSDIITEVSALAGHVFEGADGVLAMM